MNTLRRCLILGLATLLTILGVISCQSHCQSQSPTSGNLTLKTAGLTLEKLGSGIYGLIASTDFPAQDPNAAICNAGIVIGSDGVLVIDPFQNEALANLLFSTVEELTDKPIKYVLNSHYHFDHTGGNPAAEAKGIPIIGRGPIREFMEDRNKQFDPNPTPPNVVVNSESKIWLGDRAVEIEEVEGHSGGTDIVAYVPDAKIMFTGDILFNQRFPYTGDGNIRKWQNTLSELRANYPDARVLPGHGPITDSSGLDTLKTYLEQLEKLALTWKEKSLTKEQVLANYSQIPAAYNNYKFQGLYKDNLETAYKQITAQR